MNSKIFGLPLPIIFPMEPPGKIFTIINKKDWSSIICGILQQEYLKMRVKKWTFSRTLNLKNSIQLNIFFWFTKIQYFFYALMWPDSFLSWRMRHLKIISEGRGFRGGSDKKMRRMWLGVEIDGACLPSLILLATYTHIRQN